MSRMNTASGQDREGAAAAIRELPGETALAHVAPATEPDPSLDRAPVAPEYGGAADKGVVSSVGGDAPAAGDVVVVLRAENRKLQGVLDEVDGLVRASDEEALRLRWGGVVREVLEYEAAQRRVVLPAAERVAGTSGLEEVRHRLQQLVDRLGTHDSFAPDDITLQGVADAVDLAGEHLRAVDAVVVPLVAQLSADQRRRLGEDLRQVMG